MPTEITSWNGKHILKIQSEALRQVDIDVDDAEGKSEDSPGQLRIKIEPWLTALFQSEHLSLLIGTGITHAIHRQSTESAEHPHGEPPKGMSKIEFTVFSDQLERVATESAKKAGRGSSNIEDQIRVANELIRGLDIFLSLQAEVQPEHIELIKKVAVFKSELDDGLCSFIKDVLETENNIATSDRLESTLEYLTSFLVSFCSRTATRERLNLFTTNYDRLIEFGAELAGVRLIDRFVGNLDPLFRASRLEVDMHYNPPGIRGEPRYLEGVVHYTKLHGSLDWIGQGRAIRRFPLPFGAENPIEQYFPKTPTSSDSINQLLIYPNSSKDRETSEYPYVELFRDLAAATCRPNATLVTYGYGFGDEHINRIIEDMLSIPSTHLVIITHSDEGDRACNFIKSVGRSAQITVLAGTHFGDIKNLVEFYLPKPAIDRATNRMAEILKNRGWKPNVDPKDEEPQI